MKYSEIKKIATERLANELFKEQGFILKKGGLGGGFSFRNSLVQDRILVVGCGISKYGETNIVNHVSAGINFLEIEEIFAPIVAKNGLMGSDLKAIDNTTITINKIPSFENHNFSRFCEGIIIKDESGVKILVDRIKEFYYEIAVPAFESFTSIEQLVPMIKDLDVFQIDEILHYGLIKKAIIYKLCNVSEYDNYITERISIIKNTLDSGDYDEVVPKWYNTLVELKEILDKTPAKYNL